MRWSSVRTLGIALSCVTVLSAASSGCGVEGGGTIHIDPSRTSNVMSSPGRDADGPTQADARRKVRIAKSRSTQR